MVSVLMVDLGFLMENENCFLHHVPCMGRARGILPVDQAVKAEALFHNGSADFSEEAAGVYAG